MKIALLGYGKMGKTIEKIAIKRGHEVVLKIDEKIENYDLSMADIAIDFSVPDAAFNNITTCFKNKLPVICGTTGWLENYEKAVKNCEQENSAFLYASNFSIGVNLFFGLNEKLAKMMSTFRNYSVEIEEIHHTQKLDTPSGTAISLAQQIIANSSKKAWHLNKAEENKRPIYAKRIGAVQGTSSASFTREINTTEINQLEHTQKGFV